MSETFQINLDLLQCPILMGLMEDPVTLPCCGKSVSREPLVNHWDQQENCPWCRKEIDDPRNLPKNIDLSNLIDQINGKGQNIINLPIEENKENTEYSTKVHLIRNNIGANESIIGKLEISSNKNLSFKTLMIVVVDKSGSMSGNPTSQCKYSLHRFLDLTYKHKHLLSNIILYDDKAKIISIDTKKSQSEYEKTIDGMYAGGGTKFSSAFEKIIELMKNYSEDSDISSSSIIFLTDGMDQSSNNTKKLTEDFKMEIDKIWKKEYTIHTVGFGQNHDFNFLESLRKIGTLEGAYKFALPTEDTDSLSNKINSILNVISQSMIIPIKILNSDLIIINGENSKYWCELVPSDLLNDRFITILVNEDEYKIKINFAEDENDQKIINEWFSYSIDKLIEELGMISSSLTTITNLNNLNNSENYIKLETELHLELIQQRARGLISRVQEENELKRLDQVLSSVETIKTGKLLDQKSLNDLKSEGKFKTDVNKLSCNTKSIMKDIEWIPQIKPQTSKQIKLINKFTAKRFNGDQKQKYFLYVLGYFKTLEAKNWFKNNSNVTRSEKDDNDNNPLACCAGIGRYPVVEEILKSIEYDVEIINHRNKQGYSSTDLAILYGHNNTADLLLSHGGVINIDPLVLFLSCLQKQASIKKKNNLGQEINEDVYYTNTADVMLKHKLIIVTEEIFNYVTDSFVVEYLSKKMLTAVSLDVAILKGIYDRVLELLPSIDPKTFSWKPYHDIFLKSSIDHIKIVQLLVDNGKADPCEAFRTPVMYEDGTSHDQLTWPLFIACKKGNYMMFSALIQYYNTPEKIDFCGNEGNTVLWIASAGGYIDIVTELIAYGANVNHQNTKGDSPLIPACQKGFINVVEMLMSNGASLEAYNKTRDNPILICCRCGQDKILDVLLRSVTKEKVMEYMITSADIDGFPPLHASTELDKLECIKKCIEFGADIEYKTSDDNKIIAGATALHLACFYGRINSVRVLVEMFKANVKAVTNTSKQTPLHIAISQGHEQVVRFLLTLPEGKECLNMLDIDEKLPAYYANKMGNDKILEEFFTNRLEKYLLNALVSSPETEMRCADVLLKYGQTQLAYEYDKITENTNILTQAIINGNKDIVSALIMMDKNNKILGKSDEFGITPLFWLKYCGYEIHQLEFPQNLIENMDKLFENVNQVISTHPQNKMLCSLQKTSLKLLTNGIVPSILDKQINGFGLNIDSEIIENLKKSSTINHPLLGFVEKLKNKKVFPEGETTLNYIITDAKYNIIRRVASGDRTITPIHMLAIFLYTSNYEIFRQVNLALKDLTPMNIWYPFVNTLYSAISLLPKFEGEVYRAVNTRFNITTYEIGKIIRWNTFSVCSYEHKNSTDLIKKDSKQHGTIFIIQSKSGRKINKYSKYPVDAEVIFLPDSTFIVKNYYQPNIIALAQANIRDSTFKIKDKDIEKALNGEASIIIELVEI